MQIQHLLGRVRQHSGIDRQEALTELFALAEKEEDQAADIFESLTKLSQKGSLTAEDFLQHVPKVLGIWSKLHKKVAQLQGDPFRVRWQVDDAYQSIRLPTEWLLDLMAYFPEGSVSSALREGLRLADPLLALFAAISLLRRLEQIDESDLEPIAANHQTRLKLRQQLEELRMEFLMPQHWSTPEMLAASEFVSWAGHPMELGVPPEEVELAGTFSGIVGGKRRDVYLFRFQECPEPGEPSGPWMAGIAGPVSEGKSLLSPWSSFDDWEAMSPEDHFAKLFSKINGQC